MQEGRSNDYWVIGDRFYFVLNKKKDHEKCSCLYSCDRKCSTWLLAVIIILSFLLTFSYFIDVSVVEEVTRPTCPDRIGKFDCFNRTTFDFVDCENDTQSVFVEEIHCFRFLRFVVDKNIISSMAQSSAFYLFFVGFFGHIFSVVKVLLHLKACRFWGVVFIALGVLAIIGAAVLLGRGDYFLIQVNTIAICQVRDHVMLHDM